MSFAASYITGVTLNGVGPLPSKKTLPSSKLVAFSSKDTNTILFISSDESPKVFLCTILRPPSLPAAIQKITLSFMATSSSSLGIVPLSLCNPSLSPSDMLTTMGTFHSSCSRPTMSAISAKGTWSWGIYTILAPGAMPTRLISLPTNCPAAMPVTWVAWLSFSSSVV